jgi:hypothetical protein
MLAGKFAEYVHLLICLAVRLRSKFVIEHAFQMLLDFACGKDGPGTRI